MVARVLVVLAFWPLMFAQSPQPMPFAPGIVRGAGPSFTPDGNTVYTHLWKEGQGHTIMVSDRHNGQWTPSRVAEFSGVQDDLEPCVSPDGTRLFFTSARPLEGHPGLRIWVVKKAANGWSAPEPLPAPINVDRTGSGASAIASDGTLFLGSTRVSRAWPWEVFAARPSANAFAEPERLPDSVNAGGFIWSITISRDGRTMVFASERPDGQGRIDLYISRKTDGRWSPARNLGRPINTELSEVWPRFSPDGKHLYFKREEDGPIYQVETSALHAE